MTNNSIDTLAEIYENIDGAYERGKHDAAKNRAPIFRKVHDRYVAEIDDDMADSWSQAMRAHYMIGYDSY